MDIATVMGLLTGVVVLVFAILTTPGAHFEMFVDYQAVLIICGGSMASTLISVSLPTVLGSFRILRNAFFGKSHGAGQLIKDLVRYAEVARRDGILSLENLTADIQDPFLVRSIRLAVDGTDPEQMERILTAELEATAERHHVGRKFFETMGKYGPSYGIMGTLIGLIVMLGNMSDPSGVGHGMAVALSCTLYGAVFSNFICLPLADKLGSRSKEELAVKELIVRGVIAIQSGDNPRVVEQKLLTFLPHRLRKAEEAKREAA
jgi:chemotaxis protein MotA